MTDNEIIKALECCGYDELGHFCAVCPKFDKENDFCQEELHIAALDLIKRQKAELEMTRNYIHYNNLEWDLLSYSKRNGG